MIPNLMKRMAKQGLLTEVLGMENGREVRQFILPELDR